MSPCGLTPKRLRKGGPRYIDDVNSAIAQKETMYKAAVIVVPHNVAFRVDSDRDSPVKSRSTRYIDGGKSAMAQQKPRPLPLLSE